MARPQIAALLATWTRPGRIVFLIWLTLAIALFVFAAFDILSAQATGEKGDADIVLFLGMFVLTFPAAYIVVYFSFFYSLFVSSFGTLLNLFVMWVMFVGIGYAQWFIVVPWLFKKLFHRHLGPLSRTKG